MLQHYMGFYRRDLGGLSLSDREKRLSQPFFQELITLLRKIMVSLMAMYFASIVIVSRGNYEYQRNPFGMYLWM